MMTAVCADILKSLIRTNIWSLFTNVTMFCLTFHYRSALTIFFDLCFIHCCQTVSLEAIWCFRVTSNLCFLPDGAAYCPSLNTRSMHFLKLKEGIMEKIFCSCVLPKNYSATQSRSALFMPITQAEMSRSLVQCQDSDICLFLNSKN